MTELATISTEDFYNFYTEEERSRIVSCFSSQGLTITEDTGHVADTGPEQPGQCGDDKQGRDGSS